MNLVFCISVPSLNIFVNTTSEDVEFDGVTYVGKGVDGEDGIDIGPLEFTAQERVQGISASLGKLSEKFLSVVGPVPISIRVLKRKDGTESRYVPSKPIVPMEPADIVGGAGVRLLDLPGNMQSIAWDDENQRMILTYREGSNRVGMRGYDPVGNVLVDLASGVPSRAFSLSGSDVTGMTFLGDVLYGVTRNRYLYRWDIGLTAVTNVGRLSGIGGTPEGLVAYEDGLYLVNRNVLWSVNPSTGVTARISRSVWGNHFFCLAVHKEKMYTVDWEPGTRAYLYEVNPVTGALGSRVGEHVYNISLDGSRGPTSMAGIVSVERNKNGLYAINGSVPVSPFYRIP